MRHRVHGEISYQPFRPTVAKSGKLEAGVEEQESKSVMLEVWEHYLLWKVWRVADLRPDEAVILAPHQRHQVGKGV